MKFKKGDRVKSIRYDFTDGMTGTVLGDSGEFIAVEFDNEDYNLHDCKHLNPEFNGKAHRCYYILPKALILLNSKIHITFNGLTTTAEYNGKTATAKCNPTDTFDNYIGAKIALDRLFGKEENTVREGKQSKPKKYNFYVGQRVRIKTWAQMAKEYASDKHGIRCRCTFLPTMKQYCGTFATISYMQGNGLVTLTKMTLKNNGYAFSTDMLEPASTKEREA